jgi:hypothetical protein
MGLCEVFILKIVRINWIEQFSKETEKNSKNSLKNKNMMILNYLSKLLKIQLRNKKLVLVD